MTTALVPIYWRFHDRARDATTHFIFPIAGVHHHRGAGGAFVGPFYGWKSSNDGGIRVFAQSLSSFRSSLQVFG